MTRTNPSLRVIASVTAFVVAVFAIAYGAGAIIANVAELLAR